jgi:hypothetical protein
LRTDCDECKERIYRALNALLSGNGEAAIAIIDREIRMLRDRAVFHQDEPLIFAIDIVHRKVLEMDLRSRNLPLEVENLKADIYWLETY